MPKLAKRMKKAIEKQPKAALPIPEAVAALNALPRANREAA